MEPRRSERASGLGWKPSRSAAAQTRCARRRADVRRVAERARRRGPRHARGRGDVGERRTADQPVRVSPMCRTIQMLDNVSKTPYSARRSATDSVRCGTHVWATSTGADVKSGQPGGPAETRPGGEAQMREGRMRQRRVMTLLVAAAGAAALVLGVAACGGDDSSSSSSGAWWRFRQQGRAGHHRPDHQDGVQSVLREDEGGRAGAGQEGQRQAADGVGQVRHRQRRARSRRSRT